MGYSHSAFSRNSTASLLAIRRALQLLAMPSKHGNH